MDGYKWSKWRAFPDPCDGGVLVAPYGPGVYELRNGRTGQYVLVGIGKRVASRMTSLLPRPLGSGTRNNEGKRGYVLEHLADIEYRTAVCVDRECARDVEKKRLAEVDYLFGT